MFLRKMQLISLLVQRNSMMNTAIRSSKINFPTILQTTRAYSSFIEDEDDELLAPKKRNTNGQNERFGGSGYQPRSSFGRPSFNKFGGNSSAGNRFGGSGYQPRSSFGRPSFNDFDGNSFAGNRFGGNNRYTGNQGFGQDLGEVDWSTEQLDDIRKDFYRPSEITQNRSEEEIREFQTKHEITISQSAPKPILTFEELQGLPESVMKVIQKQNFSQCTPIQAQGMPIALSGKNMVGIAQTGSGKTLAFIVPAIIHILNQKKQEGSPRVLVLAPTRELAQQTHQVVKNFGQSSNIRSACLYGGSSKSFQLADIRHGCDLIIATPGRLIDLMATGDVSVRGCSYLVLDEADRMLDMGFEPQMRKIVSQIRPDRQTLMWSATWPRQIRQLAADFMGKSHFEQLTVGSTELCANRNIKQKIICCDEREKAQNLFRILDEIKDLPPNEQKTLIFAQTKRSADQIAFELKRGGFDADTIHGDRSQYERETILDDYRAGQLQFLVATDVASRGLDVNNIKHVINFDFPNTIHDYIHRIGRTGRSNSTGTAYTFFTVENKMYAGRLIEVLKEAKQEIPPELEKMAAYSSGLQY